MSFMSPEVRRDPFPVYARMREAHPIVFNPMAESWAVFRHEDVRTVLFDRERFSSDFFAHAPGSAITKRLGQSMIFTDPPRHKRLRDLVSSVFTPASIAEMEPWIRQTAARLADALVARGEADVIADLAMPLPVMVITGMLGISSDDLTVFKRWSERRMAVSDTLLEGSEAAQEAEELHRSVMGLIHRSIEERRREPRGDLISRLLAAEIDGDRLSEEELLPFCTLLLTAGNETTTNLIGNAVRDLLEDPEEMALLRARPELMPGAIEEALRHRSPVQAFPRCVPRDTELRGETMRKGQVVMAFIGSANRDGSVFPEPDRFDIQRSPGAHLAFGTGIHFCLGATLARLEATCALEALLARTTTIELATGEPLSPCGGGVMVHGVERLPVRVTARR